MTEAEAAVGKSFTKFLDPRSCDLLLGDLRNGRIGSLPISLLYFQLDAFLRSAEKTYAPEVGSIPRQLLEHNRKTDRSFAVSEMAAIDADVVFQYDAAKKKSDIGFKAYFQNPGFERPEGQHRVVLHIHVTESDNIARSISLPLQPLLDGWGDVASGHQGYSHSITFRDESGSILEQWYYIGITSRNWLERMEEHLREMRSGSGRRFHAAWRTYAGNSRVLLGSELIVLNHSYDGVMAWEEEQVDITMAAGTSLNMIPGGFKGLRFLHEHRLTTGIRISLDEREEAIAAFVRQNGPRVGVPNLLLAKLWRDDEFYLKVLAGRDDVLTPAQVVEIRRLAVEGKDEGSILEIVGARNVEQIRRIIAGKTYRRII
ncbi:MAG: hypothetical protein ACRC9K_09300 [Afipia sp.]